MQPPIDFVSSPAPWLAPQRSFTLSEPGQPLPATPSRRAPPPLLDLRNDLVFKLLFTRAPHLLADLINAVRHDETPIVVERILNPQIDAGDLDGKTIVLDLHARDAAGQLYNIEMQVRRYERWPARSAYYLARTLSEQIQRGQDYELLKPAIAIHFLAHDLFDDPEQADWRFELRDRLQPAIRLGKELQLHIIELPKAERLGCLPAALSAWVACFQHGWEEASMKDITHEPVREAVGRLKVLTMDDDARWRAYAREKAIADDAAALAYATRTGMEQGRARGLEQGLEQGREQGLAQGRRQGESALLERLLARRFGPLPDATIQRLREASDVELEAWSANLLDAATLAKVFGE
ncbi:MAG: Rpn family recombination-promoting nuclease/putative transposase [Burkholderiales bacterium]|nr:Rpn family recombination-promoting nuclease/putative transposase [Burkholderiales bacterium]